MNKSKWLGDDDPKMQVAIKHQGNELAKKIDMDAMGAKDLDDIYVEDGGSKKHYPTGYEDQDFKPITKPKLKMTALIVRAVLISGIYSDCR